VTSGLEGAKVESGGADARGFANCVRDFRGMADTLQSAYCGEYRCPINVEAFTRAKKNRPGLGRTGRLLPPPP